MYNVERIVCNWFGGLCIGGAYQPPTAVSTPAVDQAVLAGYSGAVHGADVRFTINEDGSVGDIEIVASSGY